MRQGRGRHRPWCRRSSRLTRPCCVSGGAACRTDNRSLRPWPWSSASAHRLRFCWCQTGRHRRSFRNRSCRRASTTAARGGYSRRRCAPCAAPCRRRRPAPRCGSGGQGSRTRSGSSQARPSNRRSSSAQANLLRYKYRQRSCHYYTTF